MAEVVRMPKMSDTMTEGVLAKWHKKVGDKVKAGDVVAEVETDKATMDFESFQEGTLLYIGVEEGQAVPVDAVIAVLGAEGEDYKSALEAGGGNGSANATASVTPAATTPAPAAVQSSTPTVTPESLGATVIRMPLLSDTMTEGVINKWYKQVGDTIKSDDTIADVETDKATMEVTAYAEGTLLYVGVKEGEAAKVNDIIAIVGKPGTDVAPLLQAAPAGTASKTETTQTITTQTSAPKETATSASTDGRVKASPLARKIAQDKGIDLSQVKGSAEGGRIVKKDIESFSPTAAPAQAKVAATTGTPASVSAPAVYGQESFTEVPVTQMRKTIARRLSESLFTAPHFYLTMSIDMDQAIEARKRINELGTVKVSFNDIVLKAVAVALKKHPKVNSSWLGDKIRYNNHVNIGVAVAVEDGLLVPVVRFADTKSLSTISAEVKEYAQKAKDKKLQPADWEGSTFTISNLGMYGIDQFTAIINPPDACILAVGGISQVPVVKNGQVIPGNVMKVTLSCDHRVVDGATGSEFLQTLKGLLEEPLRLLV
ncbi:pyruvate dehydrogenase complex dihydrolipoamide acetyltransferase [Solitalea lacus]|uniref:pyruvate dehydrogenase complex dihydrolipoamide acetyltransferase n=1 Tax=Solitalea lacus TaxID=2911172 RepID=UPI001ED9F79E|nr:pyruvate dehydrogenase complex dihydrolipoamide acetyltransferase [Solitalea lacus]UKJ08132.1 pyruvate dehydrogenase complex dihydrolipoamide acetyltransferase [Solitalea lacus]